MVSSLEQKVSVQIFLKDGAAAADVQTLQANILHLTNVKGVTYVSKAEALERFKERTKDTPALIQQLRGNPLPASLEVALADPREVKGVVTAIIKDPTLAKVIKNPANPEADDIKYGQGDGRAPLRRDRYPAHHHGRLPVDCSWSSRSC